MSGRQYDDMEIWEQNWSRFLDLSDTLANLYWVDSEERRSPSKSYIQRVDEKNFAIYHALKEDRDRKDFVLSLPELERRSLGRRLNSGSRIKKAAAIQAAIALKNPVSIEIDTFTKEIVRHIARHPTILHDLTPRKFEELIADIFHDMGHETILTPQTRDGGRDVMVVIKNTIGQFLTLVECKKYRPDRPVGTSVVRNLLGAIHESKASYGLICTTSRFSRDVTEKISTQEYMYRIGLKDFEDIVGWLKNYGNWAMTQNGQLWVPATYVERP